MWTGKINGNLFVGLVNSVKDVVNDVNIEITEDGMSMQSMDTSHIALCSFYIPKEMFAPFGWSYDGNVTIGINTSTLALACSCLIISVDTDVEMRYDGECFFISSQDKTASRSISLTTMDIDVDRLEIPRLDPEAVVRMKSKDFAQLCSDALKLGTSGDFSISKDDILNINISGDLGSSCFTYKTTDGEIMVKNSTFEEHYLFSWKYLHLFSKAKLISDVVDINFFTDAPLKISFPMKVGNANVTFFLAPLFKGE